ncbi:hypothetical protein HN51_036229 [Arachis hypogaea]|uniref:Uncharacterized protein n=1 Tax=Arachis hypogaea TaxID=3818 RepID=A0A445A0V6_ARAHY|nr:hypothetical protein Ahy_B03g065152 isoform A [Arachis hypogaea]RYR67260.1 hypothetical protein Ahy_A03g013571 isoform A [Arachis hypogaea]
MGAKRSSFCNVFTACFSRGSSYDDYYWEGSSSGRRIFASDEDRGRWVGEPGIDRKASDFIARYYAARVTDSESQFAS